MSSSISRRYFIVSLGAVAAAAGLPLDSARPVTPAPGKISFGYAAITWSGKDEEASDRIVQIGSQRRSTPSYMRANEFIRSGKFGDVVMVEMSWNVNQPGRWRRPNLVPMLHEQDVDWKRF